MRIFCPPGCRCIAKPSKSVSAVINTFIESTPLWTFFLATLAILAVSVEIGYRYGWRRSRQPDFDDESHINATTGAQLALMGFILAFTFSQAADNFSVRKALRLEQVVVIQTAYLRAGLLDTKERAAMRRALNEYVKLAAQTYRPAEFPEAIARGESLLVEMWQIATALSRKGDFGEEGALVAESINQVIEVHERRINAGLHKRIPTSVWIMLYLLIILSMFAMGYFAGLQGKRSLTTTSAMAASLALVIWLIADLDRPQGGFLVADTSRLQEFSETLDTITSEHHSDGP